MIIRNFSKFQYVPLEREHINNVRYYKVDGELLPSVTTILSLTKDNEYLEKWKARIGEEEAERIKNEAGERGTSMHLHLENWLQKEVPIPGEDYEDLSAQMADVIHLNIRNRISELWGSEVKIFYPGKYAGTSDLAGVMDGVPSIMDFKQSNRHKREDWIEDYKLQLCSYALAHNKVHGTDIRQGKVLMCTVDLEFQEFTVTNSEFDYYCKKWWERVDRYYSFYG